MRPRHSFSFMLCVLFMLCFKSVIVYLLGRRKFGLILRLLLFDPGLTGLRPHLVPLDDPGRFCGAVLDVVQQRIHQVRRDLELVLG